jgi:hypothetical protein
MRGENITSNKKDQTNSFLVDNRQPAVPIPTCRSSSSRISTWATLLELLFCMRIYIDHFSSANVFHHKGNPAVLPADAGCPDRARSIWSEARNNHRLVDRRIEATHRLRPSSQRERDVNVHQGKRRKGAAEQVGNFPPEPLI